jgi:hypothetical protein
MDTNQVTPNIPLNNAQHSHGENLLVAPEGSRDQIYTATPATSHLYAAWGSSGFSTIGSDLSDIGNTRSTAVVGFPSSLKFSGDFQNWSTQQYPGVDDWSFPLDPRFHPSLDANSIR